MDKRHLIAKRAARYFQSGDVVNLGIGIPSLCGNYAEPGVLFQAENGFIGVGATAEGLMVNERTYNAGGVPFIPVAGSMWRWPLASSAPDGWRPRCWAPFRCRNGAIWPTGPRPDAPSVWEAPWTWSTAPGRSS